jgi:hypothetical protein
MPYIPQIDRGRVKDGYPRTGGEANYRITLWLHKNFSNYDSVNTMAQIIEFAIDAYKKGSQWEFTTDTLLEEDFACNVLLKCVHLTNKQMVGALRCAWDEFYARKVRPYEDTKIKENGDV